MNSDNVKAFELAVKCCNNDDGTCSICCKVACNEMAEWKDEQLNLLLDAIDYAYLQLDGSYGDLALVVVDKVEYLKSLRQ